MALCINREFSLQLQGITLCNYRYLYSAANILPSKKSPISHYFSIGTHLNSAQIELLVDFTKPKRTVFVHTPERDINNSKLRSPNLSIAKELRRYGRGDYSW